MSSQDGGGGLNLGALSPDQLKQVADQLAQESQRLTESFEGLQSAINKYNRSASTLKKFKDESEGKEMLVPLTSSMYVRGSLEETSKILVDIGTGYYVEKSVEGGTDFCERKVVLLKEHLQKVVDALQQKQQQEQQVRTALAQKQAQVAA